MNDNDSTNDVSCRWSNGPSNEVLDAGIGIGSSGTARGKLASGEEPTGERILITGGAGFIGSHLASRLAADNDVTIFDNFATGSKANVPTNTNVVEGSITDASLLTDVVEDRDIVVHMAAMMGVRRTLENPLEVLDINIDGTKNVLQAAEAADVDRVMFASTSEVYGDLVDPPYSEDDAVAPKTNYAVAKLVDERYTRAFCANAGLDHTILRYFNVYGPNQESSEYGYVVAQFVDSAQKGETLHIHGDGTQTRDFTFVDDAINTTAHALGPNGANETFNVGTGSELSISDLARIVVDTIGDGRIEYVEHPRPYRVKRRCADVSKAVAQLGCEPRIDIEDGIRSLADGARLPSD